MKVAEESLEKYIERLRAASFRSLFLNAIPGKRQDRIDIESLNAIDDHLASKMIKQIMSSPTASVNVDLRVDENVVDQYVEKMGFKNLTPEERIEIKKKIQNKAEILDGRLKKIMSSVDLARKDKGYETFGLGFPTISIGKESTNDKKNIVAPIFVWPLSLVKVNKLQWLVSLDVQSGRRCDQNLCLNDYLKSKRDINIDKLPEHFFDDGILDQNEISQHLKHMVSVMGDVKTPPTFKIESMPTAQTNKSADGHQIFMSGILGVFEHQKESIIRDMQEIKAKGVDSYKTVSRLLNANKNSEEASQSYATHSDVTILPSNESQSKAVFTALRSDDMIIQGPPGTGKSQVIAELICQGLLAGKKVLVCCEKNPAMDVLVKRLSGTGLDKLCLYIKDFKKDRADVFKKIRAYREDQQDRFVVAGDGESLHKDKAELGELKQQYSDVRVAASFKGKLGMSWSQVAARYSKIMSLLPESLNCPMNIEKEFDLASKNNLLKICHLELNSPGSYRGGRCWFFYKSLTE